MKNTIAQNRAIALANLISIIGDDKIAKNLMNRYYRLCSLETTLLERETEQSVKTAWYKDMQKKEEIIIPKLKSDFENYGLTLEWFSHLPTICYSGTTRTAVERYMY